MADALQTLIDDRYPSTTVDIIRQFFARENIPPDQQAAIVAYLAEHNDNTSLDPDVALNAARDAHWQIMTPAQRAQYPQQPTSTLGPGQWLGASLNIGEKGGTPTGAAPADPAATPAPTAPAGTTVTGPGGATTTVPVPGQPYQPNIAQYDPVSAQSYTGSTDPASLAALAGMDTTAFQAMYDAYAANFQQAAQRRVAGGDSPGHELTIQEFAANRAFALQGQWQPVLDAFDYQWNAQYGQRLPGDLRMQLLAALNGLDHEQQQLVLQAEMQYVSGLSNAKGTTTGVAGIIQSLVGQLLPQVPQSVGTLTAQYAQIHQNIPAEVAAEDKVRQQTYIDWMAQHNVTPTQALLDQLMKMPDNGGSFTNPMSGTAEAFLMNMPSDIKGMTWLQKDTVYTSMKSLWQQNFGRDPTTAELQWGVGKSGADLQLFVDDSPSSVPGVTIGRKNDYEAFITSLGTSSATTHAFSAGVDDSLIHDLHQQITQQSTGTAHPGAM